MADRHTLEFPAVLSFAYFRNKQGPVKKKIELIAWQGT
jgi:hypothetical protein